MLHIHSAPRNGAPRRVSCLFADLKIDTLLFNKSDHDFDEHMHPEGDPNFDFDMEDFKNVVHFAFPAAGSEWDVNHPMMSKLLDGRVETITIVRREEWNHYGWSQISYELACLDWWKEEFNEFIQEKINAGQPGMERFKDYDGGGIVRFACYDGIVFTLPPDYQENQLPLRG